MSVGRRPSTWGVVACTPAVFVATTEDLHRPQDTELRRRLMAIYYGCEPDGTPLGEDV